MINDNTPAVWDPAAGRVYTFLHEDGRSYFGGETMEEMLRLGYISADAVVIPWGEADKLQQEAERVRYCTGPQPVTAERFDEALNCLPPERWYRGEGAESFRLSERLCGLICTFYVRVGDRFWQINEEQGTTHQELVRLALGA